MYFVDRNQIEETLQYMEKILEELNGKKFNTLSERLSQERMVHVMIESILDVGNMMIDGFIMRDPGSYEDIIDILVDEKVIPKEEEKDYKAVIELRKMLVNDYKNVDHTKIDSVINDKKEVLGKFSKHITNYLKNELDVANAFSNN